MEDGLRPSTPPGRERAFARRSETLDLNPFQKALKRMGVWGLRPQRVEGRERVIFWFPPSPTYRQRLQVVIPCRGMNAGVADGFPAVC